MPCLRSLVWVASWVFPVPFWGLLMSAMTFSRSLISAGEAESVWLPRGIPWPSTTTRHFVPLASLRFSDSRAPFFAGMNVASTKDSSQSRMPCSSSSERKARHMSLRTPASSSPSDVANKSKNREYCREISPPGSSLENPENPFQTSTIACRWTPSLRPRGPRRNQWPDLLPLLIGQHRFSHTHRLTSDESLTRNI